MRTHAYTVRVLAEDAADSTVLKEDIDAAIWHALTYDKMESGSSIESFTVTHLSSVNEP